MKLLLISAFIIACSSIMAQKDYSYHSDTRYIRIDKVDGKYKLYNIKKNAYLSSVGYEYIYPHIYTYADAKNDVFVVQSGAKFGLVDSATGEEIVSPETSLVTSFKPKIYLPTDEPLMWTIKGKEEKLFSAPLYIRNMSHSRSVSPFIFCYSIDPHSYTCSSYKIGYCDVSTGEIIQPPVFDNAETDKYEQYDYVSIGKLKGVIDVDGKQIIDCEYNSITRLTKAFVVMKRGDNETLCGLIGKDGKKILPVEYQQIQEYPPAYQQYKVRKNGKTGISDYNGEIIIPCIYDEIYTTADASLMLICKNRKWGLVTSKNHILIPPSKFDAILIETVQNENLYYGMLNGKWGIITEKGKIQLYPKYDSITYCRENPDHFVVSIEGEWLQIDGRGKVRAKYDKNPYEIEDIIVPYRY